MDTYKTDILYADPPWKQRKGGRRKLYPKQGRELDYPTLDLVDIKTILQSVSARVMFLWTIDKFLFEAQSIGEELGYRLHARIIWDKTNGVAPAFTIRYSHEYLLWMYKRPMLKIETSMRGKYTTVIREKATRHSKKPEAAYRMIEQLYPHHSKLELFARNTRDGWDSWGNEIQPTVSIPIQEVRT